MLDPSLTPMFMRSTLGGSEPQSPAPIPSWLQSGMTEAPPPASLPPTGGGLQGYEQYPPEELAALRMQRGAQGASRSQAPMPQGMSGAETLDVVRKAAFGDPEAKIPGTIAHTISDALSRPPSTWSEEEQHLIYGATTQAALMATPSAMAKPISSIANTALAIARAAPKTTAATAGTSALMLTGTEAGDKASDFRGRAAEVQPEIDKVRGRIEALEGQRTTLAGKTVPDPSTRGNAEQKRAAIQRANNQQTQLTNQIDAIDKSVGPLRDRLKILEGQRDSLQTEALAAEERGRPLVERYPWVKYGPVVGGVIAGATALDPRLRAVGQYNQLVNRLGNAVPGVEAAAVRGGTSVTNADRLALEQMRAYRDAVTTAKNEITPSLGREFGEMGKAAVPGAFVGAELGMLPSQIDLVSQGKDTPAYQAALDRFTTLPGWLKTGLNSFVGMTGGSLGAGAPTSWLGRSPQFADLPRATAAEAAYLQRLQSAAPRSSAPGSPGPASPTPPAPSTMSSQTVTVPMLPAPSRRPIFDQSLGGGRGGWRDPITGNITRAPRTP